MRTRYVLHTDTTRRFPRSLVEAFPWENRPTAKGIEGPVIPCYSPLWVRLLRKFLNLLRNP